MELFSRPLHSPSLLLPKQSLHPFSPHPPSPSHKPKLSIHFSHTPISQTFQTLKSLFKPTLILTTTTAALFLTRFPSPSLACPPQTQTQSQSQPESATHLDLDSLLNSKIKSGQLTEAISIIDQLLPLLDDPDSSTPLTILKLHLHSQLRDTSTAISGFERLLSHDPFLVEAYRGLLMTAKANDGDTESIINRIENVMRLCRKKRKKEELREFMLLVAQVRVVEGRYEDGLGIYREMVREEPRDFRPYLCMGNVCRVLGRKEEAEKMFEKYRRLVPKGHKYRELVEDGGVAREVSERTGVAMRS